MRSRHALRIRAKNGINSGYFIYPRKDAAPRYRTFLDEWKAAGWKTSCNLAYCTICYVDESDQAALDKSRLSRKPGLRRFSEGAGAGRDFSEDRVKEHAARFTGRGEPGAAEIMCNIFDQKYLLDNDLVFIGSAKTVTRKFAPPQSGCQHVSWASSTSPTSRKRTSWRSIRLFGEKVAPALRDFEPF